MNITIVMGPWLPVPPVRGGAMPKAWYGLAQEFVRAGHGVTILSRKFCGQADSEREEGLVITRTLGFAQGRSVTRDLVKDLVYAMNVLPRLPVADVLVTNDFWVPALTGRFRRSAGNLVVCAARFPKGQYWLYRRAKRIVAISSAVRNAISREEPKLRERTVVIPLPIDAQTLSNDGNGNVEAERTLLYVGRIHPEKGIELLVKAFALIATKFPAWRLKIVGPTAKSDGGGGDGFDRTLRDLASGMNVEFIGPIFEEKALAAEYRNADLFCYPSIAERGEAFGVAPLESMAAGVPPVVSALECFQDFVKDGENGWVFDHRAAKSETRLAEVLALAMRDESGRVNIGRQAGIDARRFGFSAVAKQYLDEFASMVAAG